MRVLVIEDDADAAAFVKRVLGEAGHAVDVSGDGESGLNRARTGDYDALVVDRMLPGMDGVKLLRSYRDGGGRAPALFLSALGKVDHRVEDAETAARIVALQGDLGMGGVLIANPIPEADALKSDFIEAEIEKALADAEAQKVTRKDLTPFLLQRIFELTGGTSLKANIALVENNAAVAAEIAVALARLTAPKLQAQARRA